MDEFRFKVIDTYPLDKGFRMVRRMTLADVVEWAGIESRYLPPEGDCYLWLNKGVVKVGGMLIYLHDGRYAEITRE